MMRRTRWQPRAEDDDSMYPTLLGIGTVNAVAGVEEGEDAPSIYLRIGGDWVEHVLLVEPPPTRKIGFNYARAE